MALKTTLSQFSRDQLAANISQPWFQELLEVLRNTGAFAERQYSGARPLTEMEHQALNGSYRQGFGSCVEHVVTLSKPPIEKPAAMPEPFGKLQPPVADPKALPANIPKK